MKKIIIVIIIIIGGWFAWFTISPFFRNPEADEASPLAQQPEIKDSMDSMTANQKQEFEKASMEAAKEVMEKDEPMMPQAALAAQADFAVRAHDVKGRALLINTGEEYIIRFEDFETINGPDLHIYLSSELGNSDFIDLGKIKATKGNVNYAVPAGTDIEKYNKVLVWCQPFGVLFSYADLSNK